MKKHVFSVNEKQLNAGSKPFVKIDENLIDGYLIALKEFEEEEVAFHR